MLSRFDFLLGAARLFVFSGGGGAVFFLIDETGFLRQSESIYFCNHRKCFSTIAIRPYT